MGYKNMANSAPTAPRGRNPLTFLDGDTSHNVQQLKLAMGIVVDWGATPPKRKRGQARVTQPSVSEAAQAHA